MSDKTICNLPELVGGPFKQVIYLGCSVKDFKINMGWGGESSSCTVSLVQDTMPFYEEPAYGSPTPNKYQSANAATFKTAHLNPPQNNSSDELNSDIKGSPKIVKKSDYTGKICYNVNNPYSNTDVHYLTHKDPGFIADKPRLTAGGFTNPNQVITPGTEWSNQYDIMGIPTIFKWEDIFFGGIIQNWSKKDDGSYTVEINSFAKIIKGITLILKEYYGSISTWVNGYNVPFNWAFFPSTDYTTIWPDRGKDPTTWGFRPNIVNIFGYLESQGFGNSEFSRSKGIPAYKVYEAVREIFSPNSDLDADEISKKDSPFSPYPGVTTRQLFTKKDASGSNNYNSVLASAQAYQNTNLNYMGLLNGSTFSIDFSEIPAPPIGVFINSDTMDLISFIDFCCEGAGKDYVITFDGVIRIKTVDRKKYEYQNDLANYVSSISKDDRIISYNVGEEYLHAQALKMVIGGNQKRLLQCNSFSIQTPYYKVYEPNSNTFASSAGSEENFRQPNYLNWAGGDSYAYGNVDAENMISTLSYSWSDVAFNSISPGTINMPNTVKGSYFDYDDPGSSINLSINNISPFFGIGKNGSFRYPYWDSKTNQMLLKINWRDIEQFLPGLYDNTYDRNTLVGWVKDLATGQDGFLGYSPLEFGLGDFLITETELRAAGAGFDQWWVYTQARAGFKKPSDLARILYNYLEKNYSSAFATAVLFTDLAYDNSKFDYMAYMQVASSTYGGRPLNIRPISHEQYQCWASGVSTLLRSIHSFIADLVNTHYGKTYAVRMPNLLTGYSPEGDKYDYEVTDAAWEAQGNMIDSTMFVGSAVLAKLQEEDGKIGPLLGFDNRIQFVPYGGPNTDMPQRTFSPGYHSTKYMSYLRMGFIGGTSYWPLVHNFANDASLMVPYGTYGYNNAVLKTDITNTKNFKLYCKASPLTLNPQNKGNPNIVYDGNLPKIILTTPGEVSSIADTSMCGIYEEIWSLHKKGINRPATTDTIMDQQQTILGILSPSQPLEIYLKYMLWQRSRQGIMEDFVDNEPSLINKAPLPTFAAVPIESKYYRYGPWINNPYDSELGDEITPNLSQDERNAYLNNMAGSTSAIIEETLVPWEYGGEAAMTSAASALSSLGGQYQTNIEVGSLTMAGLVIRGLRPGDRLGSHDASAILSSMSVTLDSNNGLVTTYQFRTSSKKIGLFNKELSDTYKNFNQENYRNSLKMSRENARTITAAGIASSTPNSTIMSRFRSAQLSAFGINPAFQAFNKSIIASSSNLPANFVMVGNNFVAPDRNNFQGSYKSPDNIADVNLYGSTSKSYISIIPDTEAYKLCGSNYDKVSMMSFDGLFSPISLYPTLNNSTFHMAKYTRENCPYCRGDSQQFVHHYVDLTEMSDKDPESIKREDSNNSTFKKTKTYELHNCPFCIPKTEKDKQIREYSKRNLIDPPYIIISGSDRYIEDRMEEYKDSPLFINKYSLSPIVLNSGDFGIEAARQKGDKVAHNIDIAGFGHLPPAGGLSARGSLSSIPSYNVDAFDKALQTANEDPTTRLQNNVRFMGLRGPLMVHGWGYDVNGYPVPNSSGQYKMNGNQQVFHNGIPLYKNQVVKADGTVTDPFPEHTFAKGWADLPSTWPVGPVDLRWDHKSCTWISPQGYKRVWVTLEHDLFDENPVRGHIESMGEPTDILPEGYRRVVYVSNPMGTTNAPRYSALYCEYSPENNHYLPLNVGAVFASGTIASASSATIYADYAYVEEDEDPISYTAIFQNPLNISVEPGKIGLFVYGGENGWIIQSIEN